MAVAERAAATPPRPRREREEEVYVWPDLVFIEFIAAVLFTITLFIMSALVNAPLLDQADPNLTPNPSKAPWYFLNLQELLLHMHPALAGVYVPTIALLGLAAMPYFDRKNEGQGVYFGTPNSVRITLFTVVFTTVLIWALVLLDEFVGFRRLQTDIAWPDSLKHIPFYVPFVTNSLNFPAFLVEELIPVLLLVGLPVVMIFILRALGWCRTTRDVMVALFTGFITSFFVLTIIGTSFRGLGMDLFPPQDVIEHSFRIARE